MTTAQPIFTACRVDKIKSFASLAAVSRHNNREAAGGLEHTDTNGKAILIAGQRDASKAWHERAEALGFDKSKMRKDAVPAFEFVAWTSPEFWQTASREEKNQWLVRTRSFVEKRFGKENVLQGFVHADESTPHPHFVIAPFTEKEVKKRGRKGRPGTVSKEIRLSARDFIGGSSREMEKLQTEFAAEMEDLGLVRGIPRKETGERNKSPARWRAEQAAELDKQKRHTAAAQQALDLAHETNQEAGRLWARWNDVGTHIKGIAKRLGWAGFDLPEEPDTAATEAAKRRLDALAREKAISAAAGREAAHRQAQARQAGLQRRDEQSLGKRLLSSLSKKPSKGDDAR